MFETKCVGDNYKILVTVLADVITNIHYLFTLASGVNIPKSSPTLLSLFPTSVTTFQVHLNFPTSARTFQLPRNFPTSAKLSNFRKNFPTSLGPFQLRSVLSNFAWFFPTFSETFQLQTFQLKTFQLLVFSNCPFQLRVSRFRAIPQGF